jgi:hypothetical protein
VQHLAFLGRRLGPRRTSIACTASTGRDLTKAWDWLAKTVCLDPALKVRCHVSSVGKDVRRASVELSGQNKTTVGNRSSRFRLSDTRRSKASSASPGLSSHTWSPSKHRAELDRHGRPGATNLTKMTGCGASWIWAFCSSCLSLRGMLLRMCLLFEGLDSSLDVGGLDHLYVGFNQPR